MNTLKHQKSQKTIVLLTNKINDIGITLRSKRSLTLKASPKIVILLPSNKFLINILKMNFITS